MKPKYKNKLFLSGFIALSITASLYLLSTQATPAPDIEFKTINNKLVNLKKLLGKPVLITFWASNCPSCIQEIPHFKSLYQDFHQRGLEIIAVAMPYDRPNYVVETQKNQQIPYDIVLDLRMHIAVAFGDIQLTPTTLLIAPSGKIVYQITGMFDLNDMQTRIESLLTQQGN